MCDPIWHVISHSSVVIHTKLQLLYLWIDKYSISLRCRRVSPFLRGFCVFLCSLLLTRTSLFLLGFYVFLLVVGCAFDYLYNSLHVNTWVSQIISRLPLLSARPAVIFLDTSSFWTIADLKNVTQMWDLPVFLDYNCCGSSAVLADRACVETITIV